MRNLSALFDRIESHELSALVNVASDLRSFRHAINAQPEFQELLEHLEDPAAAEAVRDHAIRLASVSVNPAYEHPHDPAVATYLLALSMWLENDAMDIVKALAESPPLWFWAVRVADDILHVRA
jgi:hypothetical protein